MQRAVRCHCSATAQPQARFRPYITERQPPAKRAALAAGALLSALQLACVPHADAKPNFILDLQTCSNFKQGARIAYCDSQPGEGYSPEAPDVVVIDYTARAVKSGSVYDGSRQFKFTLGNGEVIPGFELGIVGDEGVPPIKKGGVRTVRVPPALAYGEGGDGCLFGLDEKCRVPPGSDVEISFKFYGTNY